MLGLLSENSFFFAMYDCVGLFFDLLFFDRKKVRMPTNHVNNCKSSSPFLADNIRSLKSKIML